MKNNICICIWKILINNYKISLLFRNYNIVLLIFKKKVLYKVFLIFKKKIIIRREKKIKNGKATENISRGW